MKLRNATSKAGQLRSALKELLNEHFTSGAIPTSGRFLFYELVMRGILSKEKKGTGRRPDQDMTDALVDLRESGEIPWNWIVDETRSLESFVSPESIEKYVLASLSHIRLDPWVAEQPLILTESRSLAGVLRATCRTYSIRIASTNGQCGGFLHTSVAPRLETGQRVLYLGDFDLAGNDIEQNTRRVLERASGQKLLWERLALTQEQVADHELPVIVKHDRRFSNGKGAHEAVETEALSQRIIVEIVQKRLEERAERERDVIRKKLTTKRKSPTRPA